jgi:phosphate:Na+ symporter
MGTGLQKAAGAKLKRILEVLTSNRFLAVLVGTGVTAIIQSSSATTGILMALAANNGIPLEVALPILFGDNIGTCVTALLASIGTTKNAKRASLIHLMFNVTGTIIFMSAFPLVLKFIPMLGGDVQRQIANAHTFFNVTNVLVQVWFIGVLVKIVTKFIPGEDKQSAALVLQHLDRRLLETPSVAVGQVVKEVVRMGNIASQNLTDSMNAFINSDEKLISSVNEHEELVNYLER